MRLQFRMIVCAPAARFAAVVSYTTQQSPRETDTSSGTFYAKLMFINVFTKANYWSLPESFHVLPHNFSKIHQVSRFRRVFWNNSCRLSARAPVILTKVFHGFPQSVQANFRITLRLYDGLLLPNPIKFTSHPIIRRYTVHTLKASLSNLQKLPKMHLNISLPSKPTSSKMPSDVPLNILQAFLTSPMRATYPSHPTLLELTTLTIL